MVKRPCFTHSSSHTFFFRHLMKFPWKYLTSFRPGWFFQKGWVYTTPIMGIVWVPLTIIGGPMSLGVPENPIDPRQITLIKLRSRQGSRWSGVSRGPGKHHQFNHPPTTTTRVRRWWFFCRCKVHLALKWPEQIYWIKIRSHYPVVHQFLYCFVIFCSLYSYTIVSCSTKINFISVGDFFRLESSINPPKRGVKKNSGQDDTGIETDDFFLSALPQFEAKKG